MTLLEEDASDPTVGRIAERASAESGYYYYCCEEFFATGETVIALCFLFLYLVIKIWLWVNKPFALFIFSCNFFSASSQSVVSIVRLLSFAVLWPPVPAGSWNFVSFFWFFNEKK